MTIFIIALNSTINLWTEWTKKTKLNEAKKPISCKVSEPLIISPLSTFLNSNNLSHKSWKNLELCFVFSCEIVTFGNCGTSFFFKFIKKKKIKKRKTIKKNCERMWKSKIIATFCLVYFWYITWQINSTRAVIETFKIFIHERNMALEKRFWDEDSFHNFFVFLLKSSFLIIYWLWYEQEHCTAIKMLMLTKSK